MRKPMVKLTSLYYLFQNYVHYQFCFLESIKGGLESMWGRKIFQKLISKGRGGDDYSVLESTISTRAADANETTSAHPL